MFAHVYSQSVEQTDAMPLADYNDHAEWAETHLKNLYGVRSER